MPPLRERKTDIIILANHFIGFYNMIYGKEVNEMTPAVIELLLKYHWPGNVRELSDTFENIMISINDRTVNCCDLPPSVQNCTDSSTSKGSLEQTLESIEYESIINALKLSGGNLSKASKILELTERMLGLRIKKYNIDYKKF